MMRVLDMLFPPRVDELRLRNMSKDFFLERLSPCNVYVTTPPATALLSFRDQDVRAAIHEAKYHGARHAHELLAVVLAEHLSHIKDDFNDIRVVPIPLGTKRRRKRQFNQSEEIARQALAHINKTSALDTSLLTRARDTVSQVSLPRHERLENMHEAFRATCSADTECLYILLDDVLTTGATLQAAINALHEAGATQILPLALAH